MNPLQTKHFFHNSPGAVRHLGTPHYIPQNIPQKALRCLIGELYNDRYYRRICYGFSSD